MNKKESYISNADGQNLFVREWLPEKNPKAIILYVHGLGSHSGRMGHWAERFIEEGIGFIAYDQLGHGKSDGKRGNPKHARKLIRDLGTIVRKIEEAYPKVTLVLYGHSMGGKVAMNLACRWPERVRSLTVVDISPRAYESRWEREFTILQRMPVERFSRRLEAEEWLEKDISDWAFRKFLVSNLERDTAGGFAWSVNLKALQASLPNLFVQIPPDGWRHDGRTLFLKGGKSSFVQDSDKRLIHQLFPFAKLETIANAGHNVHFDQPKAFCQVLIEFMN